MKTMQSDYMIIKALEDGVQVIGLTRGQATKFHHSEKLDRGEVLVVQFTDHTSAIKVKGSAEIKSSYGDIQSERSTTGEN